MRGKRQNKLNGEKELTKKEQKKSFSYEKRSRKQQEGKVWKVDKKKRKGMTIRSTARAKKIMNHKKHLIKGRKKSEIIQKEDSKRKRAIKREE